MQLKSPYPRGPFLLFDSPKVYTERPILGVRYLGIDGSRVPLHIPSQGNDYLPVVRPMGNAHCEDFALPVDSINRQSGTIFTVLS